MIPNNELLDDVSKIVASGETIVLLAKGYSMLPFIVGWRDSVELTRVDVEICVGDIILAKLTTPSVCYVMHRVVGIEGEIVTLMGDGNLVGMEICRKCDIMARVTSIVKPNKSVDPNTRCQRLLARIWRYLLPVRRWLLIVLGRLVCHI